MKTITATLISFATCTLLYGQTVGIFGSTNLSVNNTGAKANVKAVFDISSLDKGLLIPRITTASRDTFTNIPTSLLIFNTTTNKYEYYDGSAWLKIADASPRYLGELYGGGIIYYLYTGSDGLQHGLIVATEEAATTLKWQNTSVLVNADRTWDGVYNDALITDGPARDYCENLVSGGFADWYLPSIDELSLLWHARFHVQKALNDGAYTLFNNTAAYWSSTESSAANAWSFAFGFGYAASSSKTVIYRVRAVRAF